MRLVLAAAAPILLAKYRTSDDRLACCCRKKDRDILCHAVPSPGHCYDLDGQTGAFSYNTAGFLHACPNKDVGCNGKSLHINSGECMEKGDYKFAVFQ
ncbi:hypothetical protein KVR01_010486 [Diaporthe batatas]|uniref:uncharacterized protein n=1 Tax=Diaporthe batatas TaxID=748121 RepID=UPI001D0486F5|nr:uncharacterized protein KVR01_010486 [Diaporthe batatas]KAG8159849.1 hypothetical protein KVR01_010486 [Diaporthe batatas]